MGVSEPSSDSVMVSNPRDTYVVTCCYLGRVSRLSAAFCVCPVTSKLGTESFVFPSQVRCQCEGGPLSGLHKAVELHLQSPDGLRFKGGLRLRPRAAGVLPEPLVGHLPPKHSASLRKRPRRGRKHVPRTHGKRENPLEVES